MTRVCGVSILAAPCCGAQFRFPRYASMNFLAFEYWTDGWRHMSLMPNDEGLRRCSCGAFVLLRNMVEVGAADDSELPVMAHVPDLQLTECIALASSDEMELAARLSYWRYLNHPYRDSYRLHRDAEEAATQAAWEAANPDQRTWWDRFRGRKPPQYIRQLGSPFTCPAFEPSEEQRHNMNRLTEILLPQCTAYVLELAELHRELGRFDEARSVLLTLPERQREVASKLITRLVEEKQTAPIRYRM